MFVSNLQTFLIKELNAFCHLTAILDSKTSPNDLQSWCRADVRLFLSASIISPTCQSLSTPQRHTDFRWDETRYDCQLFGWCVVMRACQNFVASE